MSIYYTIGLLIVITTLFAYLNERVLKLPSTIGIMVVALICSVALLSTGKIFPHLFDQVTTFVAHIDLAELVLDVMLSFLLFAGAIHFRITDLRKERGAIMLFSTLSVVISTVIVGVLMYYLFIWFRYPVPITECFLFGALISPTDPIAVLSVLKKAKVPKSLETKIAGESLFNDAVAVLLFVVLMQIARGDRSNLSFSSVSIMLTRETLGGIGTGLLLGGIASYAIKGIDNYKLEVMITLAVVMGGSVVAGLLHVSSPLAMVTCGLIIGNYGKYFAMSTQSKDYLDKFWEMLDEILNAILFLLMGFELLLIPKIGYYLQIGFFVVLIMLLARYVSIFIPAKLVIFRQKLTNSTILILVWGGLRGGVSIALALSIDPDMHQRVFLSLTYIVVIFSILVQGLTISKLTNNLIGSKRKKNKSLAK